MESQRSKVSLNQSLLTVTAADWEKLMGARESILETIGDMEGSEEFTEICYCHSDYLWDIQHEKP